MGAKPPYPMERAIVTGSNILLPIPPVKEPLYIKLKWRHGHTNWMKMLTMLMSREISFRLMQDTISEGNKYYRDFVPKHPASYWNIMLPWTIYMSIWAFLHLSLTSIFWAWCFSILHVTFHSMLLNFGVHLTFLNTTSSLFLLHNLAFPFEPLIKTLWERTVKQGLN